MLLGMSLILAQAFLYVSPAKAEFAEQIDLGPALNKCLSQSETMGMMAACYAEADKYWGTQLEKVYKQVLRDCDKTDKPAACAEKVKKMQNAWLQYTASMKGFLRDDGIPKEETISEFILNGAQFEVVSTKMHLEWMKKLREYK